MQTPTAQWYFHTGSQQEGPLSIEDMRQRIKSGAALPQHFAWTPGMENWIPIAEIKELAALMTEEVSIAPTKPTSNHDLSALIEIAQAPQPLEPTGAIESSKLNAALSEAREAEQIETKARQSTLKNSAKLLGRLVSMLLIAAALIAVGGALWMAIDPNARETLAGTISRYVPIKFFKIPKSFAITEQERQLLEDAANAPNTGARPFAVALSTPAGQTLPSLVFAGPWKDDSTLSVLLRGEPMSLVGAPHFHDKLILHVSKRVASVALSRPLPRGEYLAIVTDTSSNATVGQAKINFKDANYAKDLNAYHDSLVSRLRTELQNVRLIAELLSKGIDTQATAVEALSNTKSLTAWKKAAQAYREKDRALFESLKPLIEAYKPDTLKTDFVLWSLIQRALLIQQNERSIDQTLEEALLAKALAPTWKDVQTKVRGAFEAKQQDIAQLKATLGTTETALSSGQFLNLLENTQ